MPKRIRVQLETHTRSFAEFPLLEGSLSLIPEIRLGLEPERLWFG